MSAALLAACSSPDREADAKPQRQEALKEFEGVEFGISLEDALTRLPARLFNPSALQGCYEQVSKGCSLFSTSGIEAIYRRKMGVPYGLQLSFDKFDKLTDVTLTYNQLNDQFSKEGCVEAFLRTNSWMEELFGKKTSNRKPENGSTQKLTTLTAPDLDPVSILQSADGGITDVSVYDGSPKGQRASIFFSMKPSLSYCTIWATLSNVDQIGRGPVKDD